MSSRGYHVMMLQPIFGQTLSVTHERIKLPLIIDIGFDELLQPLYLLLA